MATKAIDNNEDTIDSRDIIRRIRDLQEREDDASDALDDDGRAELAALVKVNDECEGYGDWEHGETLIRDSYFKRYAQELAEDTGAIDHNASWPNNCIDWDRAVSELQTDYSTVEFDGVTYWMRA